MSGRRDTPNRRSACPHCRFVRDVLKPTMDAAPKDGIVVMLNRTALERLYANAKKGAKT